MGFSNAWRSKRVPQWQALRKAADRKGHAPSSPKPVRVHPVYRPPPVVLTIGPHNAWMAPKLGKGNKSKAKTPPRRAPLAPPKVQVVVDEAEDADNAELHAADLAARSYEDNSEDLYVNGRFAAECLAVMHDRSGSRSAPLRPRAASTGSDTGSIRSTRSECTMGLRPACFGVGSSLLSLPRAVSGGASPTSDWASDEESTTSDDVAWPAPPARELDRPPRPSDLPALFEAYPAVQRTVIKEALVMPVHRRSLRALHRFLEQLQHEEELLSSDPGVALDARSQADQDAALDFLTTCTDEMHMAVHAY